MTHVAHTDMATFLRSFDQWSVDRIITSPPFSGLPGRDSTHELVAQLCDEARRILNPEGTITLIVGSGPEGNLLTPYEIASGIPIYSNDEFELHSLYIWDRFRTLDRDIGNQRVHHDVILHICRVGFAEHIEPLGPSIIRTHEPGFNYGTGVTTPPDLAALLVHETSKVGDLIIDPMCGLAEIGVQALHQQRRFGGCDMDPTCAKLANARLAEHIAVTA